MTGATSVQDQYEAFWVLFGDDALHQYRAGREAAHRGEERPMAAGYSEITDPDMIRRITAAHRLREPIDLVGPDGKNRRVTITAIHSGEGALQATVEWVEVGSEALGSLLDRFRER